MPPLHIKLGLMKNFVKAMNKTEAGFKYLATKFSILGEAKIKEGVFIDTQIRQLFQDREFDQTLLGKEKTGGKHLSWWSQNFEGIKEQTTTLNWCPTS